MYFGVQQVGAEILSCQESWQYVSIVVQVKVKFTLEQATKGQMGSRGIAILFL